MLHKPTLCALFCALTLAGCAPAPAPLGEPAQSAPASSAPEDLDLFLEFICQCFSAQFWQIPVM